MIHPRAVSILLPLLVASATLFAGCRTLPPLPPVDLSDPAWVVRQGQAVWKFGADTPEVAGELLIALRTDGAEDYVHFSKTPLTLAVARRTEAGWEMSFPSFEREIRAPGEPSARFVWFALLDLARNLEPDERWRTTLDDDGNFLLINPRTGERLEGFWQP